MSQKIYTHLKIDVAYIIIFFVMGSLYVYMLSDVLDKPPQKLIYDTITFKCSDSFTCLMLFLFYFSIVFSTILALNFGFRVFEYSEHSFCIKSMFSRRCYRWSDVEEIYASTKFGADWVIFSTSDGNFYYCPYNSQVLEILKIKTKKKVTTVYDPYTITPYLRKRRRRLKQRMMFFQP